MRVKRGVAAKQRRKKIMERASGFYSSGSRCYIHARERVDRALVFAYRDRKVRKREFRSLWIQRINAAARMNGTTYSRLMNGLAKNNIELDRRVLSDMAIFDTQGFSQLVQQVIQH